LVDAAKGILGENDNDSNKADAPVSANAVLAMERLIERCSAESATGKKESKDCHQNEQHESFSNQTPEQMTSSAVRDVHSLFQHSHRLDLRRQAFEYLLAMTDLKRTLSSTAIATSHIILHGRIQNSGPS
jgi:putative heme degradation protein